MHYFIFFCAGGLVEEHLLICPVEHYQSSVKEPAEVLAETQRFKESLRKFYERNGEVAVFFERNYKTSHMQLQAVPVPKNAAKELKEIFMVILFSVGSYNSRNIII